MYDIITIGDSTIDTFLVLPNQTNLCRVDKKKKTLCLMYGEKIPISDTTQGVGGNAANVAVGMSRLGRTSAIVTELGDDINGHMIADHFEKEGVSTEYLRFVPYDTRYAVVLNVMGERTILSGHSERHYKLPKLGLTKYLYYTSLGASFENLQTQLLSYIKKYPDVKVAVNPGSYQLREKRKEMLSMLPFTDILFLNKEEALLLSGMKNIKQAIKFFCGRGVEIVAITDGERGAIAGDTKQMFHIDAFPVNSIGKTGAGDAFASGFLSALMSRQDVPNALQHGIANASAVMQHVGAHIGLLNQKQMSAMLNQFKTVQPKLAE